MSDPRRKAAKGVRFDGGRTASSRASTTGASSASSAHSGSQYTAEYNVGALEETLRKTVRELDEWKTKYFEANDKLHKSEESSKARIKALELYKETTTDEKKALERNYDELRKELESAKRDNARLSRKLERLETPSEPSSPDSSKPRRSDSKRSKDSDVDGHNARLKERFTRAAEPAHEVSASSRPPSSAAAAKLPHRSSGSRRISVSVSVPAAAAAAAAAGGPAPPGRSRRPPPEYAVAASPSSPTTGPTLAAAPAAYSPVYASVVPRSAAAMQPPPALPARKLPSMQRPAVDFAPYGSAAAHLAPPLETGNYQPYALPRR